MRLEAHIWQGLRPSLVHAPLPTQSALHIWHLRVASALLPARPPARPATHPPSDLRAVSSESISSMKMTDGCRQPASANRARTCRRRRRGGASQPGCRLLANSLSASNPLGVCCAGCQAPPTHTHTHTHKRPPPHPVLDLAGPAAAWVYGQARLRARACVRAHHLFALAYPLAGQRRRGDREEGGADVGGHLGDGKRRPCMGRQQTSSNVKQAPGR